MPWLGLLLVCIKSMKSLVEVIEYLFGIYGVSILLIILATLYVGVRTCDIIGRKGLPSLCILTLP